MRIYILSSVLLVFLTACQIKEIIEMQTETTWEERRSNEIITTETERESVPEVLTPYAQTALEKHNQLRALHFDDAPLEYSLSVENDAQIYANFLAQSGTFEHDPENYNNTYGENLHAFSGSTRPDIAKVIQLWYDEKDEYDYERKECLYGIRCRHYTQVVWKNSKRLGCASAKYQQGRFKGGYVTVCKYYPYGNILGQDPY